MGVASYHSEKSGLRSTKAVDTFLINRQARAITGFFRTTNMGALTAEAGLRPTSAQLDNRQRRYGLRLLSLPQGMQARDLLRAANGIGKQLLTAPGYSGRAEETILREAPEAFEATITVKEQAEALAAAGERRPGLTLFTDGSRMQNGAAGCGERDSDGLASRLIWDTTRRLSVRRVRR